MVKLLFRYLKKRKVRKEKEAYEKGRKEAWKRFFENGGEW